MITGELCPNCGELNNRTLGSRLRANLRHRRRVCLSCSTRWSTVEVNLSAEELEFIYAYGRLPDTQKKAIREVAKAMDTENDKKGLYLASEP